MFADELNKLDLISIDRYLDVLWPDKKNLEMLIQLAKRENSLCRNSGNSFKKRDSSLVKNLSPKEPYVVVNVGRWHVPSVVEKLQNNGYRTMIHLAGLAFKKGELVELMQYIEREGQLLAHFQKTRHSDKVAIVLGDIHTMDYPLSNALVSPDALLCNKFVSIALCLEHAPCMPDRAFRFLMLRQHVYPLYDHLRKYATECLERGIDVHVYGLSPS